MIRKLEDFKDRFNKALSIRNVKPADLSRATGISDATISQYRSGYAKPKEKKLSLLADALDVNPTWLMGLDVPMEYPKHTPGDFVVTGNDRNETYLIELENKARELYKLYENASPEIQAAVDAILKSVQPPT